MTVCLTELGRSWLAPWQEWLAYSDAELKELHGGARWLPEPPLPRVLFPYRLEMFRLYFPAQGMTLWVTRDEFRRSR